MALSLSEVVRLTQNVNWSYISNFSLDISPVKREYADLIKWGNPIYTQKKIDLALKSVDVPQHSCMLIEEFIGTRWSQGNSRDELFILNMTFRDLNGGELYRKFKNALQHTKLNYFEKCVFDIKVFLDSNDSQSNPGEDRTCILETNMAYITSVSQLQLSHENGSEILEFSVEFKFNTPLYSQGFIDNDLKIENPATAEINQGRSNGFTNALNKGIGKFEDKVKGLINNW